MSKSSKALRSAAQLTAPLRARIAELEAAEEGSKVAFGHVVDAKRASEDERKRLQGLLDAAYERIRVLSHHGNAIESPLPEDEGSDSQGSLFEGWWRREGQFLRAGGGQYEMTFAWHAWQTVLASSQPGAAPRQPIFGERDSSRRVTVDAGALAMVRNALRRDAEEGKQARGEMLALLDASTVPAAQQPERRGDGDLLREFLDAAATEGVTHLRIPVAPEPVAVPHGFAEAVRLAKVAVEECPTDAPMVMDWMEAAMKVCRLLAAPPAPSCEPQDAPLTWPQARDIARLDDMSPNGHLRLTFDSDNDVCVEVYDGKETFASVEFCNGGGGGGKSSHTRAALIALMVAIERDNAECPIRAHPRFSGVAK